MYLENIFAGSEDIRRQLPAESSQFNSVDVNWMVVMKQFRGSKTAKVSPRLPCRDCVSSGCSFFFSREPFSVFFSATPVLLWMLLLAFFVRRVSRFSVLLVLAAALTLETSDGISTRLQTPFAVKRPALARDLLFVFPFFLLFFFCLIQDACTEDGTLGLLTQMNTTLEKIQKSLDAYLETKVQTQPARILFVIWLRAARHPELTKLRLAQALPACALPSICDPGRQHWTAHHHTAHSPSRS